MTIHDPAAPLRPPPAADQRELSPIGLICDSILSVINAEPNLPESARMTIGVQVGGILGMFSEAGAKIETSKKRISKLQKDMRALKERLRVLSQAHFGNSSERTLDADPGAALDLGFGADEPDEDDELEEEGRAKGKGIR